MEAVAWKNNRLTNDNLLYVLQVDGIKGIREHNSLSKILDGWEITANAYDPKSKTETLIFKRDFKAEADWKRWARKFPYLLEEITEKTGKQKPYKLGLAYQQKTRGRRVNE
jgi:hypothetical protein